MLDPLAVLDRFGDEEFLRELWMKARGQLPKELTDVDDLRATGRPQAELEKRLHKLRGLMANFLEGGQAITQLRQIEEVCRQTEGTVPDESWEGFRETLEAEASQLEAWLSDRGFPCG